MACKIRRDAKEEGKRGVVSTATSIAAEADTTAEPQIRESRKISEIARLEYSNLVGLFSFFFLSSFFSLQVYTLEQESS